jgi:autotransporter-associated beta strand protein
MLSPGDAAYGATFTFTTAGGDWLDSGNWTPTGVPGAADLAKIRTNTAAVLTLNAGAMTIGGLLNDSSNVITLSNATADATNSTLTVVGLPDTPLLEMDRAVGSTVFTIQGANSGSGTGTLGLVLGASGDIRVETNTGSGPVFNISADISETGGSQSIRKTGTGTLNLAGANSFTGSIEIRRGRVQLDFGANPGNKLSSSGSLIFSGGTLFMSGNASQNVTQSVNGTYINAGQNAINIDVSDPGQMSATLNAGALNRSVGAYANINYTLNGSLPGSIPRVTTTTANNSFGILGGWLTVGNNDWAVNDGSGNIIPMPSGSYATKNDVTTWATNDNITNSGPFTGSLATDLTIGSLRFNDQLGNTVNIGAGNTLTVGSGGILLAFQTASTNSITGGNVTSGSGEMIITTGSNKTLALSSIVTDNGSTPVGMTKSGSGTLILNGAHTYSGPVHVNTGTLATNTLGMTGSPGGLGTSGTVFIGSGNIARVIYTGPTTSSDRDFVFGDGGAVIQVNTNGAVLTLSGSMTGAGSFTKGGGANSGVGSSSLIIVGAKTFGGPVTVNPGLLSVDTIAPIGQPSGLGTGTIDGTVTLGNGTAGTLQFAGTALNSSTDRTLQLGLPGGSNGGSINLSVTQNVTLQWDGNMFFNSGQPSSVNGTSITFNTGPTNVRPFTLESAGTIIFNGSIGTGTAVYGQLRKSGSGTVILGGSNNYAIGTTVNAGTLITNTNFSNGTITNVSSTVVTGLNVLAGAARVAQKATSNDPAGTTVVPSLNVGAGAQLDLTNNAMVLDYTAASPLATIQTYLTNGYNNGSWDGTTGINSSAAHTNNLVPGAHITALGYGEASALFSTFPALFAGENVDNTAVVIRYVNSGDANLDGSVDSVDFNLLASNFGGSGKQWIEADFNYDGAVDTTDFNLLASNFGETLASPAASPAVGTLVPEPAGIAIGLLMSVGLLRRSRRKSD